MAQFSKHYLDEIINATAISDPVKDALINHLNESHVSIPATTKVEGKLPPLRCTNWIEHHPTPARIIWHHTVPLSCGGLTNLENCVGVCDNCHISLHRILWELGQTEGEMHRSSFLGDLWLRQTSFKAFWQIEAAGRIADIPKVTASNVGA